MKKMLLVGIFTASWAHPACQQGGQSVTQPIGTLVRTWETSGPLPFPVQGTPPDSFPAPTTPMEEVNYICAQWDTNDVVQTAPFATSSSTTEIILTQPQHFVRLLGTPTSSPNGAWIMRSEYVRGKTPQELRNIFALPQEPIAIVNVEMPASPDPITGKNYALWTGIAAPIEGDGYNWGAGGAVQNRLIVDFNGTHYFPTYMYTRANTRDHQQPIGDIALSYKPLAGCGNTGNVANYLDSFIPLAYSDLENVYTNLDYLNYINFGNEPLQNALSQISPECFGKLSFLHFRNVVLFNNSILDQQILRQWEKLFGPPCASTHACDYSNPRFIIQGVGEVDKKSGCAQDKFHIKTYGLVGCFDGRVHPHVSLGAAVSGMGNKLHWGDLGGKVHGGTAQLGLYAEYAPNRFFIDGLLTGGFTWNSACRPISFYGVDRVAKSHQRGGDLSACLQGGCTFLKLFMPIARLSYFFNRQNHFKEHGAESLNLSVNSFNAHTLRSNLGVEMSTELCASRVKLLPQVSVAWVNDTALDKRQIKSHLVSIGNSFSVYGRSHKNWGYFVGAAGLTFLFPKCCALYIKYDAEIRKHLTIQALELAIDVTF